MRTRILALVVLCLTATSAVRADSGLYNQWASMEFKQWDFSPDSYYYSRVWRRILDLPWPLPDVYGWVPGNGFHDRGIWIPLTGLYDPIIFNPYALAAGHWDAVYSPDGYVNERWRQQLGLRTPAAAESVLYKQESHKEEDYWSRIRNLDVATLADRMGVLSGLTGAETVTATERQEAMDAVNEAYDKIKDEKVRDSMMEEYYELQEKVAVIDGAHMDNARKLVALQDINREYAELKDKVSAVLKQQHFREQMADEIKATRQRHSWVNELARELGLGDGISNVLSLIDFNKL